MEHTHTHTKKTRHRAVTGVEGKGRWWLLLFALDEHVINGNRRNGGPYQYSNSLPSSSLPPRADS